MTDQGARDQLTPVAVLFVDISGSTTLYAQRGDAAAFGLTIACLELVGAEIKAVGGRVLRQLGDGVLAVFATPVSAVRAAIEIQHATEDPACSLAREGVRVRSGISSGLAVLHDDDVYGDVANVAARLVGRAAAGEIFLSGAVYEELPAELRAQVQLIDQMLLRNRPEAVPVYKYAPDSPLTTIRTSKRRRTTAATMELQHGDVRLVVGPQRPRISIGRDPDNDICIDDDAVSRSHAEITLRGDRFMLVDRSTNGTYVDADNGPTLRLVRDELALTGMGRIVLGAEEAPHPILYRVAGR
jgi:class 3 adenylate cyclase